MNELEKKVPIVGLLVDNRYVLACKDWGINNRPTYYLAQNNFTKEEQYFCQSTTKRC